MISLIYQIGPNKKHHLLVSLFIKPNSLIIADNISVKNNVSFELGDVEIDSVSNESNNNIRNFNYGDRS
jgi:hypothetical protein